MALFELTDLASYLQQDLDTATATLARDMATGVVTGYTGQMLEEAEYTHLLPVPPSLVVTIPQRPVTAVTSVTVDGALLASTGWEWTPGPWVTLAAAPDKMEATVVYTAGYATVPTIIKAVAIAVASRMYVNSHGVTQEGIDDYQVTYAGSSEMSAVGLLPAETRLLDRYRPRSGSLALS